MRKIILPLCLLSLLALTTQTTYAATQPSCADPLKEMIHLDVRGPKDILKVGDPITTPGGLKLTVQKVILDGHKGVVYKAANEYDTPYAVKVPRYDLPGFNYEVLKSLQKEVSKIDGYIKLKVPYAVIFEHGPDYLVKEWIEGLRGDEWVKQWVAKSRKRQARDEKYLQLMALFESISEQGAYIGNLKSINMIHDGKRWVIVDSGMPKLNPTASDADKNYIRIKYRDVFQNRWL